MRYLLGAVFWLLPTMGVAQVEPERPNVVFIFIDDMGYGDLSVFGNDAISTPHIDRLATQGRRLTQFYAASPICSPSRVAVMTGQYPQRWRIYGFLATRQQNIERRMADYLDPDAVTLPRLLSDAGYATAHFGKWHMGGGRDISEAPLPQAYGLDESLVSFEGLGDRILVRGHGLSDSSAELGRGDIRWVEKHEQTEIYVDRAIDFIRRHRDEPFYLHVWPNDVHDPFQPSEEQWQKFRSISDDPEWQKFYAVLDEMDRQIGRLVEAIDGMGLSEKTMIVLTSDNGPTAWPRYYQDGRGADAAPGYTAGLRGRKWSLYEGGIRMPFIARWTGRIPAGTVNDVTVASTVDLLPSLATIAGVALPEAYVGDGEDLSRELLGEAASARERPIFWEYNARGGQLQPGLEPDRSPTLAMRSGDWKLLLNGPDTGAELYNLAADRTESQNLRAQYPQRVAWMSKQLVDWFRTLPTRKSD